MRRHHLLSDDHGREAFAYLAILMMVLSSSYLAYSQYLKRKHEESMRAISETDDLEIMISDLRRSVEETLRVDFNSTLCAVETDLLIQDNTAAIDSALESGLEPVLAESMKNLSGDFDKNHPGRSSRLSVSGIEVSPVFGSVEGIRPAGVKGNGTRISGTGPRCEVLGVEALISVDLGVSIPGSSACVGDDLELKLRRASLAEFIRSRSGRLESAISCGDLDRLATYLLTHMAQQKAAMGYGRMNVGTGSYSPPLLTSSEITSAVDLSVLLLSQSYLRSFDEKFARNLSRDFNTLPGSGGVMLNLSEIMNFTDRPYDPASLILLACGWGSEGNDPSLEQIIRPLINAAVDLMASRYLIYFGINDEVMAGVGSVMDAIGDAEKVIRNGIAAVFGREREKEGKEAAWDILQDLLSGGGLETEGDIVLMDPSLTSNTAYPLMDGVDMVREFVIHVSEDVPEMRIYEDPEGDRHNGSTKVGPEDEFLGYRCDSYRIRARYRMGPFEPVFTPLHVGKESKLSSELVLLLGEEEGEARAGYSEMVEEGKLQLTRATESVVDRMTGPVGSALWDDLYHGWDRDNLPSMNGSRPPILDYLSMNIRCVEGFVKEMAKDLIDLQSFGTQNTAGELERSYRDTIAQWLGDNYDRFTEREEQIRRVVVSAFTELLRECRYEIEECVPDGISLVDEERVIFRPSGSEDISWILKNRSLMISSGIGKFHDESNQMDLIPELRSSASRCFDIQKAREVGSDPAEPGIYTEALLGVETRSGSSLFQGIWEMGAEDAGRILFDAINQTFRAVAADLARPYRVCSLRCLDPPPPGSGNIYPSKWSPGQQDPFSNFTVGSSVTRASYPYCFVEPSGGIYRSDPGDFRSPYRSFYNITCAGSYVIEYGAAGRDYSGCGVRRKEIRFDLAAEVEVDTFWPMDGFAYRPSRNLMDDLKDNADRAVASVIDSLTGLADDYLSDTMGPLAELPPLLVDLAKSGEIDPSEISRIISNVSMEISGSIRDGARKMIGSFVESGTAAALGGTLDMFGVDMIDVIVNLGMLKLRVFADTEALTGGEGTMISMDASVDSIGADLLLEVARSENDSVRFNGAMSVDLSPFHMRIEMDPFMDSTPHMISVEGRIETSNRPLRFSVTFPDIDLHRTSEISLGSTIGIAPTIFIPPIGLSAVVDAGFRIRYRMPEELEPHLNEVCVESGRIRQVEIFDPRNLGIDGYSLETRDGNDIETNSVKIDGGGDDLIMVERDLPVLEGEIRLILREPGGLISDEVVMEEINDGWYSRDADGYGIWRWTEGSPGEPNSDRGVFSFGSMLLSMAVSSIGEAWDEASSLYGLTFDGLVHFIRRSLDLFVERVLAAVEELVVDARMFLKMKVVLGAGASGGFGLELSFLAEGRAVAGFLKWIYENVKVLLGQIMNPEGAGDFHAFPVEICEMCHLEFSLLTEVETPSALNRLAGGTSSVPSEITLGVIYSASLSAPLILLGMYRGGWSISCGVYIRGAPRSVLSVFYDLDNTDCDADLWLARATVWQE